MHRGPLLLAAALPIAIAVLLGCSGPNTAPGYDSEGQGSPDAAYATDDPITEDTDANAELSDARDGRADPPDAPDSGLDAPTEVHTDLDDAAGPVTVDDAAELDGSTAPPDADEGDAGGHDAGADTDAIGGADVGATGDADEGVSVVPIVVAGDSWSTGLVSALDAALSSRGFDDVELRWRTTARAGSQARDWVANAHPPAFGGGVDRTEPRLLDALAEALDRAPRAEMLVLLLGGNDLNRDVADGFSRWSATRRTRALDAIAADLRTLIAFATDGRPWLRVVIVSYDYFHLEFMQLIGMPLPGLDTTQYNEAFLDLARRQRDLAASLGQHYVHNYGLFQHLGGDRFRAPFTRPLPPLYPEYDPGDVPRPGGPPNYEPFAVLYTYPSPLDWVPDGIHPSAEGNRAIADNAIDQVLSALLRPDD